MSKSHYQLSTEQAKKINSLLPKGYLLITPQDLSKKTAPKPAKQKKTIVRAPTYSMAQQLPIIAPKRQKKREDEYVPIVKIAKLPPSNLQPVYSKALLDPVRYWTPAGRVFDKFKQNPSINLLSHVKMREYESDYGQIINKIDALGESYKISDLENDIAKICLRIYESYHRGDQQYNDAAELQKCFNQFVRIQKENQIKEGRMSAVYSSNVPMKKKPMLKANEYHHQINNQAPTINQKRILGQNIKKLPSQYLQHICWMIDQTIQNKEYSFDIDTLHVKKFRELQEYVKKCMEKTGEWEQRNFDKSDDQFSNESSFVIYASDQEVEMEKSEKNKEPQIISISE